MQEGLPQPNAHSEETPEELQRRLSRVVLRSSEREGRLKKEGVASQLFEKLTAQSAERLADLMKLEPVFFNNDEDAPKNILLSPEIVSILPEEFFSDPMRWIEAQSNLDRGHKPGIDLPTGESIAELEHSPYDISAVKEIQLSGDKGETVEIVSKRIHRDQLEEIARAKAAYDAGIPTPKIYGEIIDKGNIYAWFERIQGINLVVAKEKLEKQGRFSDQGAGGIIRFLVREEDVVNRIDRILPGFQNDEKEKLLEIWQAYSEVINLYETGMCILGEFTMIKFVEGFSNQRIAKEAEESTEGTLGRSRLQKFLKEFKLKSVLDLVYLLREEAMKEHTGDPLDGFLIAWEKIRDRLEREFGDKAMECGQEIDREALKIAFGFDVKQERKDLRELVENSKIPHKDFADRNLMVSWDFENDCPKKSEEGGPNLYIIDWETEKSSSRGKSF